MIYKPMRFFAYKFSEQRISRLIEKEFIGSMINP